MNLEPEPLPMQSTISELLKRQEPQRLEFKESFGKDAIETVAAFSNASGGVILIGVTRIGGVKGVSATEEIIKEWVNEIKQATQPQIFPEINITESDHKTIVTIAVQEYPVKPVSYKGKYYKRAGASNHLLTVNEIVEMQLYSINSSFDSFPVPQTTADLKADIIKKFFRQIRNTGRINLDEDDAINLKKIGLIKDNQATFASLLLFGEHNTGIHIGRFKSPDMIIDDILIKSPLVDAVEEAMTFIKKNISLRYDFTGELRRKETWQYPLPVIRELLLNAVIHKDYRNPTDVIIKIFDDHIRFVNPGSLMGGLKPEDLIKGDYIAVHRNKLLAEAFYLRGDIEKFGTGFFRIRKEIENSPELHFVFESFDGFTRTSIDITPLETPQETPQDTPQETPQVQKLILILEDEQSRVTIQELIGLSDREYFRKEYIKPAIKYGLIEMTIPDKPNSKHQKYRLTTKGKKMKDFLEKMNTPNE